MWGQWQAPCIVSWLHKCRSYQTRQGCSSAPKLHILRTMTPKNTVKIIEHHWTNFNTLDCHYIEESHCTRVRDMCPHTAHNECCHSSPFCNRKNHCTDLYRSSQNWGVELCSGDGARAKSSECFVICCYVHTLSTIDQFPTNLFVKQTITQQQITLQTLSETNTAPVTRH